MKILATIFIVLICLLQYKIWLGQGGYNNLKELKARISEQEEQNNLLKEQNELLKKEILLLRKNPAMLEERAREQLGLIKSGETFYRIIPKEKK